MIDANYFSSTIFGFKISRLFEVGRYLFSVENKCHQSSSSEIKREMESIVNVLPAQIIGAPCYTHT